MPDAGPCFEHLPARRPVLRPRPGSAEAKSPPGRHTLEVWHPRNEPVEKTLDFQIIPDAVTELVVRLRPPSD